MNSPSKQQYPGSSVPKLEQSTLKTSYSSFHFVLFSFRRDRIVSMSFRIGCRSETRPNSSYINIWDVLCRWSNKGWWEMEREKQTLFKTRSNNQRRIENLSKSSSERSATVWVRQSFIATLFFSKRRRWASDLGIDSLTFSLIESKWLK